MLLALLFVSCGLLINKLYPHNNLDRITAIIFVLLGGYALLYDNGALINYGIRQAPIGNFICTLISGTTTYFYVILGIQEPNRIQKQITVLFLVLLLFGIRNLIGTSWTGWPTLILGIAAIIFSVSQQIRRLKNHSQDSNKEMQLHVLRIMLGLPVIWVFLDSSGLSLPQIFEWIVAAEALIWNSLRLHKLKPDAIFGQVYTPDISPSIRIAHSGVQILNHSFKNKLLTMEMALGTMKSKLPDPHLIQEEMDLIEHSIDHLKHMVNRLRDRTKEITLHEEAVKLDILLNMLHNEIKTSLPENVQFHIRDNQSAVIVCDATHLKEVFLNVIRNSIEALKNMTGTIQVYLPPPLPGSWLTICIEDNGPGIPNGSLHRVFEPYFTTKAGKSNFGLGLSYCYNVMRASQGSIKINSSQGKGTTVVLSFPPQKVLVYPSTHIR
ncbi:sensor histidine kinase [Gorillibacterium sp. sgz5001074]|uniref:sensor histidine kinase n=1 Tax=Gorillibacterium sp. sgz5001074 TaxID=3446695 RepID=UPI003F664C78